MKVLGVIPARIGSTRIPRKMLADICGKPLIQRTIERTKKAQLIDDLVVSTDSEEIAKVVESLGVRSFITSPDLPTGTDRVGATLDLFTDYVPDIVVNIWGDEPLFPASAIDDCITLLLENPELNIATIADKISTPDLLNEPSIVKILTDLNNNVLCFSRSPIPYAHTQEAYEHYHVIGALAVRPDFMKTFLKLPRTPIEKVEGVEQMRVLEHGHKMRAVKGDFNNLGVNTPDELEKVREIYEERIKNGNED